MAKNYMADVAKMLGVELEEEFMIPDKDVILKITAKDGLIYKVNGKKEWRYNPSDLQDLLMGKYEIVKLPWKPKKWDWYYYPNTFYSKVVIKVCDDMPFDYAMKALGMCYKTQEEAEAHFAEDYKKLTGKELEE